MHRNSEYKSFDCQHIFGWKRISGEFEKCNATNLQKKKNSSLYFAYTSNYKSNSRRRKRRKKTPLKFWNTFDIEQQRLLLWYFNLKINGPKFNISCCLFRFKYGGYVWSIESNGKTQIFFFISFLFQCTTIISTTHRFYHFSIQIWASRYILNSIKR